MQYCLHDRMELWRIWILTSKWTGYGSPNCVALTTSLLSKDQTGRVWWGQRLICHWQINFFLNAKDIFLSESLIQLKILRQITILSQYLNFPPIQKTTYSNFLLRIVIWHICLSRIGLCDNNYKLSFETTVVEIWCKKSSWIQNYKPETRVGYKPTVFAKGYVFLAWDEYSVKKPNWL